MELDAHAADHLGPRYIHWNVLSVVHFHLDTKWKTRCYMTFTCDSHVVFRSGTTIGTCEKVCIRDGVLQRSRWSRLPPAFFATKFLITLLPSVHRIPGRDTLSADEQRLRATRPATPTARRQGDRNRAECRRVLRTARPSVRSFER